MDALFSDNCTKAILLMGGRGSRFKSPLPKQFHFLSGKKVYQHTLERFLASGLFQEIILVCTPEWLDEVRAEVRSAQVRVVPGGKTRQQSAYLGLLACGPETDFVCVHDAVRPFVSLEILQNNLHACQKFGAVDTCIASADTLVFSPSGATIEKIPDRTDFLRGQTPQSFAYDLILEAHQRAQQKGLTATDDCALVLAMGKAVHIVAGEEVNIKITTDLDLYLAEQLMRRTTMTKQPQTKKSLRGKTFAITGGTGEIGQAIAAALEKEGANAHLLSRTSAKHPVDLTAYAQVAEIFADLGPIDGVINSVGLLKLKELSELSEPEIEQLIATNLSAVIYACKHAQVKEGGAILNIASSAYARGRKGYAIYSAAKAAVVNFTQALAEERPELHVHALAPQRTRTRMRREHFPDEDPASLLTPEAVARQAIDLLQESSTTGLVVEVRREEQLEHSTSATC